MVGLRSVHASHLGNFFLVWVGVSPLPMICPGVPRYSYCDPGFQMKLGIIVKYYCV